MESIKTYFESIPSWHRSLILAAGLFFFYILEYAIPYVRMSYKKMRHAGVNIFFTVTSAIVNFALAFLMVQAADYVTLHKFGLLYLIPLPTWAFILCGLLIMDLVGAWLVHYLQHKIKWMWKFHLIHHADTHVDASTANRHHPGESIFRFLFTVLAILISGAPIWLVLLYQSVSVLLSQFNHANIRLPHAVDKALSLVIVSPNMHKVHHHYVQPYTDSNYANIFSVWDRLFGTFKTLDRKELIYGIDTHMQAKENTDIKNLMAIPFQPYRAPKESKFGEQQAL
jgi:sterol desaturase/sphingolipid hydroxylase (fatty acid hydroxylase superfamily)